MSTSVDLQWPALRGLSADESVALVDLLLPKVLEVRGCYVLAATFEQSIFDEWWGKYPNDARRIERALNHVHLYDVVPNAPVGVLTKLRDVLARTWLIALADQFPGADFEVFTGGEPEEYGPTVGFAARS